MVPAPCLEVKTFMEAFIHRLNPMTWEPVEGRKLRPMFSSGASPLRDKAGLVLSHVSEEDVGHEALVA